ncbi:MAG: DUF3192 domain-containing protein [Candidatus Omnitrophica bacterium]|nr:DUF3192 domain-containing protein [Candidatus Omnitrophota bacterium]
MRYLLILCLFLSLSACAHLPPQKSEDFTSLHYGMTKMQLIDLLGGPDTLEVYKKSDETKVEFYIYAKTLKSSKEPMPVCLIDNKVVGWGKSYYEDHVNPTDVRIR